MRKLKVLQLTDMKDVKSKSYCKQFKIFLSTDGYKDEQYYLTKNNIIIDIDDNIDESLFKEVIIAGAKVRTMYYVIDNEYSSHCKLKRFQHFKYEEIKEYNKEKGVLFKNPNIAKEYEKSLLEL
ncbi:hypothetical protein [Senegalia massiliensis]|uniref:Uncharacterized protein n=1 Tax=Senegalia massiliensis TaxID=1720316 RepID=A0A845QVI5_9CLOT|nr:hypothetical protein [Senegalia massiliensis]NBI06090.1 hypothetical protein [Senegalia massiliensis]